MIGSFLEEELHWFVHLDEFLDISHYSNTYCDIKKFDVNFVHCISFSKLLFFVARKLFVQIDIWFFEPGIENY
jgi:hypothetical protein